MEQPQADLWSGAGSFGFNQPEHGLQLHLTVNSI